MSIKGNINNKLDRLVPNEGKTIWNYYTDNLYVVYADFGFGIKYPVIDFTLESSTSNYYKIEAHVIIQSDFTTSNIGQTITLSLYNSDNSYLKEYTGILQEFSCKDASTILSVLSFSQKPEEQKVYKIVLYPELWNLDQQKKITVYHDINRLNLVYKILDDNNIDYTSKVINEFPNFETITQYNETDCEFIVRLLEEQAVLMFYDFSETTPVLTMISDQSYQLEQQFLTIDNDSNTLSRNLSVKSEHAFEQVLDLFIESDNSFTAETTSSQLYAGSIFSIKGETNSYYLYANKVKFSYTQDNKWVFKNYFEGYVLTESCLRKTKVRPNVIGQINAYVVGEHLNSLNVNDQGKIQVRYIWGDYDFSNMVNLWKNSEDDRTISAWIPLMHWGSAGTEFGNFNYPRVGQQVVVGFLNSDADFGIVLGCVFGIDHLYPLTNSYYLDDRFAQTRPAQIRIIDQEEKKIAESALKSDFKHPDLSDYKLDALNDDERTINVHSGDVVMHHKSYVDSGTNASRFNEISMINKNDAELINILTSKDIKVDANDTIKVRSKNQTSEEFGSQKTLVHGSKDTIIKGDYTLKILDSNRFEYFQSNDFEIAKAFTFFSNLAAGIKGYAMDSYVMISGMKLVNIKQGEMFTMLNLGNMIFSVQRGNVVHLSENSKEIVEKGKLSLVGGHYSNYIKKSYSQKVGRNHNILVVGDSSQSIWKNNKISCKNYSLKAKRNVDFKFGKTMKITGQELDIVCFKKISIKAPEIDISVAKSAKLKAVILQIEGQQVLISGTQVMFK